MNYKGIQIPLHRVYSEDERLLEIHTIVDVTFNPCIVTFESGVSLEWNYTKEEFDIYIEASKLPTVRDQLNVWLKGKQVLMDKSWWEIIEVGKYLIKIELEDIEKEYLIEDILNCRIK